MSGPAPGAAEPADETWTYGGIRADAGGKKWHAWVDPAGQEHWFARTGSARTAIGSRYTAQISRRDDGTVTLHATPAYAGSRADPATRAALQAQHAVAQARLEALRAERDDARSSALDEAIAPLAGLAAGLRTGAQRDALAAYVIRKLHNAWAAPKPPGGRK